LSVTIDDFAAAYDETLPAQADLPPYGEGSWTSNRIGRSSTPVNPIDRLAPAASGERREA